MEDITLLQTRSPHRALITVWLWVLIKRNGTNYGPIPARAIMYCSALAWPRQPVPTSKRLGGMTGREGEDVTAKRAKLPSWAPGGSSVVVERGNTQRDI